MSIMRIIKNKHQEYKWRERFVSFGDEYPDKTFYIIRRRDENAGLFSYVFTNLGHIKYAVENGWIPVVDMMNYPNPYIPKGEHPQNAWECFFEQPCGYKLRDIERAKNVVLSNGFIPEQYPTYSMFGPNHHGLKRIWKEYFSQYVRFNADVWEKAEREMGVMPFISESYAVILRGTDYLKLKPKNHPIQPSIEQAIQQIDSLMNQWGKAPLFLVTEDHDIVNKMVSHYGQDLNLIERDYLTESDLEDVTYVTEVRKNAINDVYIRSIEYITQIIIASKCKSIIAGLNGGAIACMLMADSFQNEFYFELGYY